MRRPVKVLIGAGAGLLAAVALVGGLHHPAARPLLAWIGVGCPAQASPTDVESARRATARALRGVEPATQRPALGFVLDEASRDEVTAWAEAHALDCALKREGTVLLCANVPAELLGHAGGAVDDLSFAFEPEGLRLVTVSALRNRLDPESAAAGMRAAVGALEPSLGRGERHGEMAADYLGASPMRSALVEYRFRDYIAQVSALNLGERVVLREHYMTALD